MIYKCENCEHWSETEKCPYCGYECYEVRDGDVVDNLNWYVDKIKELSEELNRRN